MEHLKNALLKYCPQHEYVFFNRGEKLPGNVDVVHYPYFDPFFLTLPFRKKHKTVVTVHDLTTLVFPEHFSSGAKGKLKWRLQKRSLRKADAIITDSISSQNDIAKFTGVAKEKISVVYLSAGEKFKKIKSTKDEINSLRAKYNLPEKFLLYVGDVTWNKNLPRLVEAVKIAGIPLVMVGKALGQVNIDVKNPWNKDLMKVQKGVKDNPLFHILGFIPDEDLVLLYNMATVFVMPSIYEGFGFPVLEAMSCGVPVITTKEASLSEIAGESAYFVDAFNTENIAKGIETVWNDKNLQTGLSKAGEKQAKKFSWEKTARETVKIYEKTYS